MIAIVDYGSGNVGAIARLAKLSNIPHRIVSQPEEIKGNSHILLPGVGAFDYTMTQFHKAGLTDALKETVFKEGALLMGICVGMHVLATSSDEGEQAGLDFIPGTVRRFKEAEIDVAAKVPHMGWNAIKPVADHPLLADLDFDRGFYFLHSYHYDCDDEAHVLGHTQHGKAFSSIVGNGQVFGVQFHPEKSHSNGIQLISNFAKL